MTDLAMKEEVSQQLPKAATGIQGLDEITGGGLPAGRPTLVCGSAGCGKTLLSLEFLVRGAMEFGENGVFLAFEETAEELSQNVRSLGFDLDQLIEDGKIVVDYVHVDRGEIDETGEYDLEGLFIRLADAIDQVGAKRVVLDTIESLFGGLSNDAILRSELRRLFRWLKERGVTAVITGERGEKSLTRQGLEEYVSDCVILLDHRVSGQLSTRRLRVVKYRGTTHGTNEYPFLIDQFGISVLPITSLGLKHGATNERVSTGVAGLDSMLGGKGVYRASSILLSGTAGTGKTTIAAHFADASCRRGERCLYLAFEESPDQIIRNIRSVGVDLKPWVDQGLLEIQSNRPSMYGLETHLTTMYREVRDFRPQLVIMDPITSFLRSDGGNDAEAMLVRMIDFLKGGKITSVFTSLTRGGSSLESSEIGVSSLIDTWLVVREIEQQGERNRGLYVIKSRGMSHSDQIREFQLTDEGLKLKEAYVGPEGVLTGSARLAQEAREEAAKVKRQEDLERKQRMLERKRQALDAQIAALRIEFEGEEQEAQRLISEDQCREDRLVQERENMARSRKVDPQPQKAQKPT
ncbi:MAG TPA: circadian clock protein KaiC [Gemmatimonadales bacterium]|jgi:circadian clock protein KaiC|nr:circadian clock protein KaiC [Gemmatimonadales bacterium]